MSWVAVGVGLALAAGGAYVSHENTVDTNRRTDNALAKQILNQSLKQREADRKVNEQVETLEGSTAADERAKRLDDYMQTLRASRGNLESGLTPNIGSSAFRADAANDANDVMQYAGDTAGLMARIDAAGLQRQGEAFGYGNLATDLSLIGREAQGQNWLDELRVKRAARRNAGKDALAAFLGGAGSAVGSAGAGSSSSMPTGATGTTAFGYGSYP
jgi:hypothetical protein